MSSWIFYSFCSFLVAKAASSIVNYKRQQREQQNPILSGRTSTYPSGYPHAEDDKTFMSYVQSLYGKEYQPSKIQLRTREIAYKVSDAITLSYDYNNYYLLINAYMKTKNLPKETLRSRILGDDPSLRQVFMSTPYDAICIAMPPSCLNDNQTVTGIINRMESVWAEYATAHIEQ